MSLYTVINCHIYRGGETAKFWPFLRSQLFFACIRTAKIPRFSAKSLSIRIHSHCEKALYSAKTVVISHSFALRKWTAFRSNQYQFAIIHTAKFQQSSSIPLSLRSHSHGENALILLGIAIFSQSFAMHAEINLFCLKSLFFHSHSI